MEEKEMGQDSQEDGNGERSVKVIVSNWCISFLYDLDFLHVSSLLLISAPVC